jgi:hypothetical protein
VHRGYIKLWRKIFDSGIQHDPATFMLWIWILCNVTRKPLNYIARGQKIRLEPGELIVGRKKLSKELMVSEQSIRTCIKNLKNWENLTIRSTNRFSIIKVINWELYQEQETQINQQINQELTSSQPAANHKTRSKEVKNVKNRTKESGGNGIPEWIPTQIWADFKEFRIRKRAPLTSRAIKGIVTKLESLRLVGNDPESVLEQSIVNGWAGVFEIKKDFKKSNNSTRSEKVAASMDIMARREYERQREEAEIDAEARNRHDPTEDVQLLPS